jgi:holin-like protein
MKFLRELFWIFLFSFVGEFIAFVSPIPVPGSVLGMLLLFGMLQMDWIKMEEVETAGNWLVNNMALFFVPAGIALITNFGMLQAIWWQVILIVLLSTAFMIVTVGWVVQWAKRRSEKKKEETSKRKQNKEGETIWANY